MLRLTIGLVLTVAIGLAGCAGSEKDSASPATTTSTTAAASSTTTPTAVMSDVVDKKLDVALREIEHAGFEDAVDIKDGGTFGVMVESRWTVCKQKPATGRRLTSAPTLTVDRSCEGDAPTSTEPPDTTAPANTAPANTTPPTTPPTLTAPEVPPPATNADIGFDPG